MADLPSSWMYLMFVGGFATCLAQAVWRRDGRWALAFGIPLLLCAERAGLPVPLVAWGLIAWGVAAALFGLVTLARLADVRPVLAIGLVGAIGLIIDPANAERQIHAVSLHLPPPAGLAAERMLRVLVVAE